MSYFYYYNYFCKVKATILAKNNDTSVFCNENMLDVWKKCENCVKLKSRTKG